MKRTTRVVLWVVTCSYWAGLFTLTHTPAPKLPPTPGSDKVKHFVAYLTLSVLVGVTFWVTYPRRRRRIPLIVLAVGVAYGAFDELTQPLVNRAAEWGDWLADAGGAATAAALLWLIRRAARRRGADPLADSSSSMLAPD